MNIFETLGPKLRKAILLTESNRAMREMLKGNIHPMALKRKGMLRPAEQMERGYLKGMENKRAKHGIRDLDYAEQHAMGLPYNKPGYAVNRQSLADHTTDADTPKRARKATRKFLRNNPNDKGWTHTLPGNESVVRGHETDELLSKAKSHATIGAQKRGDKQPMQIGNHRGLDVLGKEMQDTARLKAHGSSLGDKVVVRPERTIAKKDNTLKVIPERSMSLRGERHKTGEYDLVRRKAGMDPKSSFVGPQEMRKLRNARHDMPGAFISQPPERPVINAPMARKAAKMKRRQLRAVSKGLASKYGDKFMKMRGDKPNYADRFKGKAAPMMTNKTFGNIPESAVARAGNLQEGLWDSIKSGARYIARGAANTLGKIRSAGVVDEQTFNRDARNVGRAQRAVGSKLNIGLTHDDKFPAPLALAQPGKPGDAASVALVGLPPKGKRSARALVHEINHLERGAKGPLSDEGLKTKFVPKIMKTRRNSLMKQEDLHVKLQKGEITDEQFRKKAHKARRAERRLKREIGNDLDKFDHINARRSLRDEAKASAGLLRRGPKGVKGMEMQSAFRTYVSGAAPSKFKGGSRQPDIDRKVRDWQGNKTPLPRSPEQMRAKPVLSENPEVKRKRDELAHRLRNFRKAGGLYPEGLENKSWLKLSATARAGNLQEARAGGYKFSSTQVALPPDLSQKIMAYGKQIVKDQDLADDGRDEHPHITIKYGLHTNDPKEVARALRGVGPIKYKLGAVSKFEAAEYDVLKIAVISDDLRRVNMRLRKLLKCTDTHPIYNPHVTIAYVRKGFPLPRPSDVFDGATGVADVVEFSAKNGKMHKLKLAQRRRSVVREALSEQTRAMIPKNKFAAPTMLRVGHEDKGLYPIFDKKSAESALKLSGRHPHLKREIARRAAAYGVKPEKKGTRYA